MIFKENTKAIYLQIADRICDSVLDGTFDEESRIPSVREYAAELQVNPNTVMRTYEHLTREEIIFNRRGIGFFIAPGAKGRIEAMNRETFLNGELCDTFRRLRMLGVTPAQLADRYDEWIKEN
ncbi:MAG: GntR family transcriptional regulator [Muribaculaceae bacterium]|nr:GntR family transcriptional regulator [Muribaculaceae bacterium]